MRIINPIGGIILLFVLLGTLGCSEDSFQDEAKPVICPSVVYPEGAKLARVWYGAGISSPLSLAKEYVYDESGRISKATLNMFMTSGVFCLKKFTSTET